MTMLMGKVRDCTDSGMLRLPRASLCKDTLSQTFPPQRLVCVYCRVDVIVTHTPCILQACETQGNHLVDRVITRGEHCQTPRRLPKFHSRIITTGASGYSVCFLSKRAEDVRSYSEPNQQMGLNIRGFSGSFGALQLRITPVCLR